MIRHSFYDLSSRGERGVRSLPATAVPLVEVAKRQFTLLAVAFFAIANLSVEGRQEVKRYIGRLKILALRPRDVIDTRAKCPPSRWRRRLTARCERSCRPSR